MSGKAKFVQSVKPVKTTRNVLVQPFKTKWPLVPANDAEVFNTIFTKVPNNLMIHGLKDAMPLLSQGKACAVFLSSDFHPQILGKQIIRMARRNSSHILILAVEKLRCNGSWERLVAIPNSASCEQQVSNLLELMTQITKANGYEDDLYHISSENSKSNSKQQKIIEELNPETVTRLHLTRDDLTKRAFVPEVSIFAPKKSSVTEECTDYISFKRNSPVEMEVESDMRSTTTSYSRKKHGPGKLTKDSTVYVPLTVNRIQGNLNRKKRKLQTK
ncbi:uncharacterized protein LOC131431733 [Malaya genurostris]|uniref:uncharacterized protein LOC131431733 n=1 Tax=Malaya genurostris TaxID=325434 RepID=UPI0026F3863C|nr:uncharacterized protein LOC131431733 [Malaya genurostris]